MKTPACAALILLGTTAVAAPRPLTDSEQAVLNFGFATQLGSGIYSLSGRTLQVYRLPVGYSLPAPEDARARLRFTLPVTIGFLDFEARDVIDTGLPQRLDTYSVVPGLELDYAVTESWHLEPFGEAGIARDTSTDVDQRVYSLGLRSRYDLQNGATGWQGYAELVHTAVEDVRLGDTDDFVRLRLGATARRPFVAEGAGRTSSRTASRRSIRMRLPGLPAKDPATATFSTRSASRSGRPASCACGASLCRASGSAIASALISRCTASCSARRTEDPSWIAATGWLSGTACPP